MRKSENINELAAALSKAQGEIRGALKDSENPFLKNKYADLESCWEVARGPLSKNGLAVIQTMAFEQGEHFIFTTLTHSSGQWIEGMMKVDPVKKDPQGMGSCISYYRRYQLAAIVGIYQTDDDGEGATRGTKPPHQATQTPKPIVTPQPKPKVEPSALDDVPASILEPIAVSGCWDYKIKFGKLVGKPLREFQKEELEAHLKKAVEHAQKNQIDVANHEIGEDMRAISKALAEEC